VTQAVPQDPAALYGRATPRIDGPAKVTGAARYASDEPVGHPAHACLVTSAIARGRVAGFDLADAQRVPGVLDILTHENVGDALKSSPPGPDGKESTTTLESDRIWHDGQIIAVVVAESFEAARDAARRVVVRYHSETPAGSFDDEGVTEEASKPDSGENPARGDITRGFADAAVQVDAQYATPTQHHNPIELFTTTCVWEGERLTVYEPSQFMHGVKAQLAKQLGIEPRNVRAISRVVGGAFGSKGGGGGRTVWIAIAARRLGRPVKLVASRSQGFTIHTYRAETRHRVRLGATRDGRLTALSHDGQEIGSRPSKYRVGGVDVTARMYASPNIATSTTIVHADRNTPGYMRAPPETPYMFALESAMDELAVALAMDPIELRRVNDTQTDPVSGRPFSSRSLMQCYDAAAARFGWSRRNPAPASMRDGDWMVGYGCATACYPSNVGAGAARLALDATGKASVAIATHEIGTVAATVVAITAARALGIGIADVAVAVGDSDLPAVVVAGGSNNAATAALAVAQACEMVRARLAEAAVAAPDGPLHFADPATLQLAGGALVGPGNRREALADALKRVGGRVEVYAEHVPPGLPPTALRTVEGGESVMRRGTGRDDVTAFAFGAHLAEVRVHRWTREIRVPRSVSAFAAGTIVNPLAAHSQLMGGAIWGISAALHEETELDPRAARYVNDSLEGYLVPVNADVPSVEVIIVPEQDTRVNELGIKGVGELGIVGMNAAIANAVFHATGKRIRELPIRIEDLL